MKVSLDIQDIQITIFKYHWISIMNQHTAQIFFIEHQFVFLQLFSTHDVVFVQNCYQNKYIKPFL